MPLTLMMLFTGLAQETTCKNPPPSQKSSAVQLAAQAGFARLERDCRCWVDFL
jgi:hypothetical protein